MARLQTCQAHIPNHATDEAVDADGHESRVTNKGAFQLPNDLGWVVWHIATFISLLTYRVGCLTPPPEYATVPYTRHIISPFYSSQPTFM